MRVLVAPMLALGCACSSMPPTPPLTEDDRREQQTDRMTRPGHIRLKWDATFFRTVEGARAAREFIASHCDKADSPAAWHENGWTVSPATPEVLSRFRTESLPGEHGHSGQRMTTDMTCGDVVDVHQMTLEDTRPTRTITVRSGGRVVRTLQTRLAGAGLAARLIRIDGRKVEWEITAWVVPWERMERLALPELTARLTLEADRAYALWPLEAPSDSIATMLFSTDEPRHAVYLLRVYVP